MALTYFYPDAYLQPLVTEPREQRAIADVVGQFETTTALPAFWKQRLVILRAYVITSQESQRAPDDLFSAKLKTYSAEWDKAGPAAIIARDAGGSSSTGGGQVGGASFVSVSLERC